MTANCAQAGIKLQNVEAKFDYVQAVCQLQLQKLEVFETGKKKWTEAETELRQHLNEKNDLKAQNNQLNTEMQQIQGELCTNVDLNRQLLEANANYTKQIQQLKSQIQRDEERFETDRQNLDSVTHKVFQLQEKKVFLETSLRNSKEKLAHQNEELTTLKTKMQSLETEKQDHQLTDAQVHEHPEYQRLQAREVLVRSTAERAENGKLGAERELNLVKQKREFEFKENNQQLTTLRSQMKFYAEFCGKYYNWYKYQLPACRSVGDVRHQLTDITENFKETIFNLLR
jgi:chromosome segregation ATPase